MTPLKTQESLLAEAAQTELEQRARMPGGISRHRALQNARSELNRLKPHLSSYITDECTNLEIALSAAGIPGPHQAASIRAARVASQRLVDVAEPMGFILVALIAKNLCEVFEVASDVRIEYPRAVLDCHFDALRLIQQKRYRDLRPQDLPELTSGLARAVQVVKKLAAAASGPAIITTPEP